MLNRSVSEAMCMRAPAKWQRLKLNRVMQYVRVSVVVLLHTRKKILNWLSHETRRHSFFGEVAQCRAGRR